MTDKESDKVECLFMKVTLEAGYSLAEAVQFKEEAVKEAYCSGVSLRSLYDV